jgi:hypothetical protein
MSKHTKGPWRLEHFNDEHGDYACSMIMSSEGRTISKLIPHHGDVPTISHGEFKYSELDAANARLIAAAPEMLEALERIYCQVELLNNPIGRGDDFCKLLKATITKANGRE